MTHEAEGEDLEHRSVTMRILLLMAYLFHQASADPHSLKYCVTVVTPGISFPEFTVIGEVDIMQAEYYDDNIRKLVPKTDWIKTSVKEEEWETRTLLWLKQTIDYKSILKLYMKKHHHTEDPPSVTLFQKNSSSPVVCHATCFYPKEVAISWQRNKKDLHKDVGVKETLPNEDDTFQKRSNLRVPPEELHKNKYTCVVQHISLKDPFEVDVPKNQGPDRILGIILGVVTVCFCIDVFGFWNKKKNMPGESPDENASEQIRMIAL